MMPLGCSTKCLEEIDGGYIWCAFGDLVSIPFKRKCIVLFTAIYMHMVSIWLFPPFSFFFLFWYSRFSMDLTMIIFTDYRFIFSAWCPSSAFRFLVPGARSVTIIYELVNMVCAMLTESPSDPLAALSVSKLETVLVGDLSLSSRRS